MPEIDLDAPAKCIGCGEYLLVSLGEKISAKMHDWCDVCQRDAQHEYDVDNEPQID